MVSRVFTVALSSVRIIPWSNESTPPVGALIKPGALRTFPFISRRLNGHLLRKARRDSRPKSMPRRCRRRKAHGSRRREISQPYRGNQVEIVLLMNDDDVLGGHRKASRRRRGEGRESGRREGREIINYYQVNGPETRMTAHE